MSSYPPPPTSAPGIPGPLPLSEPQPGPDPEPRPESHLDQHPISHYPDPQHGNQFDPASLSSSPPASTPYGLHALQAVSDVPVTGPAALSPHQQYLTGTSGTAIVPLPSTPTPSPASTSQRATRLRRACDICSLRKVKCDVSGPPCRPCRELNVDCTFHRAMKRRGPPNKHAEAAKAKKARLETTAQDSTTIAMATPPAQEAAEMLASIAANDGLPSLDAESIAPFQILSLLVDDFFTYIHPLVPFPHEPTFRQSFVNREDRTSREFLALLASMIGCLVASFPRSVRFHLKTESAFDPFPRAMAMIERCRTIALEARGSAFTSKDAMSVYDAATSYFLGLSAGYTLHWNQARRFMAETLSFLRELQFHRLRQAPSPITSGINYVADEPGVDLIQDQLTKRVFWVMMLGVRSLMQLGAPQNELLMPPETPNEPYPDFPIEVDDKYIHSDRIEAQPYGILPLITGFNACIRVYKTADPILSQDLYQGISSLPWDEQKVLYHLCLQNVKQSTDDLPRELRLNLDAAQSEQGSADNNDNNIPGPSEDFFDEGPAYRYYPPTYPDDQPPNDLRHVFETDPERRRLLQFEIQKTNIYTSQLATRSYYVERYLNQRDAVKTRRLGPTPYGDSISNHVESSAAADTPDIKEEDLAAMASRAVGHAQMNHSERAVDEAGVILDDGDEIDAFMRSERELVVRDLLTVLGSIPQRNMEPNGYSLISKIRQVASTLVKDRPERKGPLAMQADGDLKRFLDILVRLEKTGPARVVVDGTTGEPSAAATTAPAGLDAEYAATSALHDYSGGMAVGEGKEEEELRNWAGLRDYQVRFARSGGFEGNV